MGAGVWGMTGGICLQMIMRGSYYPRTYTAFLADVYRAPSHDTDGTMELGTFGARGFRILDMSPEQQATSRLTGGTDYVSGNNVLMERY